ncbi:hypothetical protein COCON_G00165300 [Conger conger]|uniref:Knr4/Smi1-like domain-containing protein n=2 Tax=Conger conger TaxID=82655 RepID=A0A9Q1HRZ0_CONCO|nr:tubulin polyglutamylase complex subunit 2 isoform X1 [Conger conger]KAJ8260807.1 hypothetical protein COCON_G00165300 [Conger conger]
MEDIRDIKGFKGFVERLTLGITRVLEGLPGVMDVRFVEREPVERRCLMSWEQKHECALPEDLKDFYLTTDGFTLTWSTKLESQPVPLGSMVINRLAKLLPLSQSAIFSLPNMPTLADLDTQEEPQESDGAPEVPHFDERSRILELDPCGGNGKVCLVYRNCTQDQEAQDSEVWFLDRALYWHYLSSSFTAYYRLMITHLGLPEWQYNFTPYGPSPQAKQWACLYRPLTSHSDPHVDPNGEPILNRLDPSKAFRGKVKPPQPKKKSPAQTGGGGGIPKARLSGTRR